jgi:F-type H+-transporting ATPase subunit a
MSIVFLILSILSMAAAIAVKVMFVPASDGIDISGAHVFFTLKMPIQDLPIT